MTNVIPFKRPKEVENKCSFCGKKESEVKHLFHNDREGHESRHICNECVSYAKERLSE